MTRVRGRALVVVTLAVGCVGRDDQPVAPPPMHGAASSSPPAAPDDPCEPTPKEGDPCAEGDGYCVLSWGSPGGYSAALWCRDGRWARENERNVPDSLQ